MQFAGAGHILAGSDYPHAIGSIPSMMKALGEMQVSEADRAAIFGGNAAALYHLAEREAAGTPPTIAPHSAFRHT